MNSRDFEEIIRQNNKDIAIENKNIEEYKKKIEEFSSKSLKHKYEEKIKKAKRSICELEIDNQESIYEIKKIEIKTMRDYLENLKENGKISKEEYMDKIASLFLYSNVEKLASQIKILNIEAKKDDVSRSRDNLSEGEEQRFSILTEQRREEIADKQNMIDKNIKKFKRRNFERQFKQGEISEEEYNNAKNQIINHEFSINDVDSLSEDMNKVMDSLPKQTTQEKFEEYIKQTRPKTDILETIEIDDYITKTQLFQLYGFEDKGNLQLIAMKGYDHQKYSELSKDLPDKEAGEGIALYVLDKDTGEIKNLLENQTYDEFQPADLLSKDVELDIRYQAGNIVDCKSSKSVQEIATFGYKGLNLTFFRDQDGSMKIARKNAGKELQEISTRDSIEALKSIDEILKERQKTGTASKNVKLNQKKSKSDQEYDEFDYLEEAVNSPKNNEEFDEIQHSDEIEDMHFDDIREFSKAFFKSKGFRDFTPKDFEKIKADVELKRQVELKEVRAKENERDSDETRGRRLM